MPSDRCRHGSLPGQCGLCQIKDSHFEVWVSGQRKIYHRDPGCEGLAEGKAIANRKGFALAEVRQMTLGKAVGLNLVPCLVCEPPEP